MKKHGCLWWVFIGWWWVIYTLPFRVVGAIIKRTKTKALASEAGLKKETHKVAGVSYHQEAIQSLGTKNPDYSMTRQAVQDAGLLGKWISEYKFSPQKVELIPEPDNPHSENGTAVKVVVDGAHIGYVSDESSQHINDLLNAGRIAKVSCSISGGNKKRYVRDGEDDCVLEHDDFMFWARLTITTK